MTRWLAQTTQRRGELTRLAACVGVSPRTLRAWRAAARAQRDERRVGRPPRSACETQRAEPLVRAIFEELVAGHDGWRSVAVALERRGEPVPTRLVQELVRALELERAQRVAERIATNRVHVEVLARDALWGVDSTLVGRTEEGEIHALPCATCACDASCRSAWGRCRQAKMSCSSSSSRRELAADIRSPCSSTMAARIARKSCRSTSPPSRWSCCGTCPTRPSTMRGRSAASRT